MVFTAKVQKSRYMYYYIPTLAKTVSMADKTSIISILSRKQLSLSEKKINAVKQFQDYNFKIMALSCKISFFPQDIAICQTGATCKTKHYEILHMQYIQRIFSAVKIENFSRIFFDIYRLWVHVRQGSSNEYPQSNVLEQK